MVKLQESKILVIEDEKDKRDFLTSFLIDSDIDPSNLKGVSCSDHALTAIRDLMPDIVLLDVKIPHYEDGNPDSRNSNIVINAIEAHNNKFENKIKTIIISATTEDKGLQSLIANDAKKIFSMMDKSLLAKDPSVFKTTLKELIEKALNTAIAFERPTISLFDSYGSLLNPLKTLDSALFKYINNEIISPFESITPDTESIISQAIIIRTGMVVEDLIEQFNIDSTTVKGRKLTSFSELDKLKAVKSEEIHSVWNKLTALSGRKYNKDKKGNEISGNQKISWQACEYAQMAYRNRNHASHTGTADLKNENIYTDNKFTKEFAGISISLVMPLLQDYIKYKTK